MASFPTVWLRYLSKRQPLSAAALSALSVCLALCLLAWPARAADIINFSTMNVNGQVLYGALAGMLATAACYLFFIWTAIRDRSQLFLIAMLLALLAGLGLSTDYKFGSVYFTDPIFTQFVRNTALIVFYIASCFFTLQFLETAIYNRAMAKVIYGAIVVLGLCFMLLAFNTVFMSERMVALGIAICCILLVAGLYGLLHRVPGSLMHMLAFLLLLAGNIAEPAAGHSLLPNEISSASLFYVASGAAALVFALGIARQFSSRQEEKERQLSLSNERFALAALGSNEGLFDWDVENKSVFFADRFKKLVGRELDPNEDGLEQWLQLVDPVQQERVRRDLKRFMEGEAVTIAIDYRIRRKDGRLRWLYTSGVALRDPKTGKMRRLVGSIKGMLVNMK